MQETFKKRTSLIYIPVSPTTPLLTVEPELADSEWSGFLKNWFFYQSICKGADSGLGLRWSVA